MVKLFRCNICGDPYVGETAPSRCPFCGAYEEFIVEAKNYEGIFDVELTEQDKANAEHALHVELSNASFYACAAAKTNDPESAQLFKALKKIEAEHASIWRKILKISPDDLEKIEESCSTENQDNLKEASDRESRAIEFYKKAAKESDHPRLKQLFGALVLIEQDHLDLDAERLN